MDAVFPGRKIHDRLKLSYFALVSFVTRNNRNRDVSFVEVRKQCSTVK